MRGDLAPVFICGAPTLHFRAPFSAKGFGFPIPFDGPPQAFAKINLNLVPQLPFSEPDIGQRVDDVAGALRTVPDLTCVTSEHAQYGCRLIERDSRIGGDIEDGAGNGFCGRVDSKKIGVHDVLDEGEITALLTISPDDSSLVRWHLPREFSENSRYGDTPYGPVAGDSLSCCANSKDIGVQAWESDCVTRNMTIPKV